jgi:hypothetical protein
MGLAVKPDSIAHRRCSGLAVVARGQVWFTQAAPELAARVEPAGRHDACFLTRSSHFTGEMQTHELGWAGDELWLVNTAFSCLRTLDGRHCFVPRWTVSPFQGCVWFVGFLVPRALPSAGM